MVLPKGIMGFHLFHCLRWIGGELGSEGCEKAWQESDSCLESGGLGARDEKRKHRKAVSMSEALAPLNS